MTRLHAPRPRRLRACSALALLLAIGFGLRAGGVAVAAESRELEPAPPWIFFPDPDPDTDAEISALIENSFGDLNKTVLARDLLVRRYGLWSVKKLREVMERESNESRTWNASLTASALRDALGNAPQLWPLLDPLVDLADHSAEPYRRAFAALALGSFHGPRFVPSPPRHADPLLVRRPETEAIRHLEDALQVLGRLVVDGHPQVEVAAALALAKSGDPDARTLLRAAARLAPTAGDGEDPQLRARLATLIGVGLLPREGDEGLLAAQLRHSDARVRAAAALAVALQALGEPPAPWVESPARMLRALVNPEIKPQLLDGAEAVFARGALALRGDARTEWRAIYDIAMRPSTEDIAKRAAAQCLLFCPEPWLLDQAAEGVRKADEVVAAAFLLLLGSDASEEGVAICDDYLSNGGRSPKARPEWDVRFYAALGLLRALSSGRVTDAPRRKAIFDALDAGASRGLARGPFRDALRDLLDAERRGILESTSYVVSDARIDILAATFVDEPGLLAQDLRDAAVTRLNAFLPKVFSINRLRPGEPGNRDKTEIPQRFLALYLERYPYFSRLDLRSDRGRRPWPHMPPGEDPEREVRRP